MSSRRLSRWSWAVRAGWALSLSVGRRLWCATKHRARRGRQGRGAAVGAARGRGDARPHFVRSGFVERELDELTNVGASLRINLLL